MARTGNFGQSPTAYPSLDNTLVAIARQWQEQRAQNIMNAWQKGGTFEKQKATDQLVLKFWKDRMDKVSKDDPLYDTYSQAHQQLDYTIHESKMTAQYAQGKASDAQMIHFYLGWAKKVPKNSEFYRVLQRDAGQYMRNQKNASIASQRQAEEDRYQRQQASTRKGKEAGAEYIVDVLRRVAQSGYADNGVAAPIGAPGSNSDFSDFDPGDPEAMLKLLDVINGRQSVTAPVVHKAGTETTAAGNPDIIYHDDNGRGITGMDIMKQLDLKVPDFQNGQHLDTAYVSTLINTQLEGLDERIKRAQKTGHMTDVKNLMDAKNYFASVKRQVASWPVVQSYDELRATRDAVWNDDTATPKAQVAADDAYKAELSKLLNDPRIEADDNLRSRLAAEINGTGDTPTLAQSTTGLEQGQTADQIAGSRDTPSIANDVDHRSFLEDQIDQVTTGAAVWAYGRTNPSTGVFTPGPGAEIGAVPPEQIQAMGGNPQTVVVTDPMGGQSITVAASGTPIYAHITDENGNEVKAANGKPIGYEYRVYKGGSVVTSYGFQSKDNGWVISDRPPWKDDLPAVHRSDGGNRLEVDFSSEYQNSIAEHGGTLRAGDYGNGIKAVANRNGKLTVSFDPQTLSNSTDERNVTGGVDPATDFHSLTLATYTQTAEGLSDLKNAMVDHNSVLYKQLFHDSVAYGGGRFDERGQYIPGTGDQTKIESAMGVVDRAAASMNFEDFIHKGGTEWQRDKTGSAFEASTPQGTGQGGQNAMPAGAFAPGYGAMPLPSDALRGVAGWAAFAGAFKPGTNQFEALKDQGDAGFRIKTSGTITVPGMPPGGFPGWTPQRGTVAGGTNVLQGPAQGTGQVYGLLGTNPVAPPPPPPPHGHEAGQGGMGGY